VISICTAPIINSIVGGSSWGNHNCNRLSDEYNYEKKEGSLTEQQLKEEKRQINVCKRQKAMHGLEYASLICDITFGGVCALLGLLHYLEVGKAIEKKSGLIGIIAGTIGFVLTLVYVIFSGYIFNNDYYISNDNYQQKLFPNEAYLKWNGLKYVHNYDEEKAQDDPYLAYIKWKDLGLKQYNYNSELYKNSYITGAGFASCKVDNYNSPSKRSNCDYIWKTSYNQDMHNKYIYDRWITTLILSVFISLLNLGVILFGFFLFTQSETSPGGVLIPMTSTNAA
jgi:hypothetical protein